MDLTFCKMYVPPKREWRPGGGRAWTRACSRRRAVTNSCSSRYFSAALRCNDASANEAAVCMCTTYKKEENKNKIEGKKIYSKIIIFMSLMMNSTCRSVLFVSHVHFPFILLDTMTHTHTHIWTRIRTRLYAVQDERVRCISWLHVFVIVTWTWTAQMQCAAVQSTVYCYCCLTIEWMSSIYFAVARLFRKWMRVKNWRRKTEAKIYKTCRQSRKWLTIQTHISPLIECNRCTAFISLTVATVFAEIFARELERASKGENTQLSAGGWENALVIYFVRVLIDPFPGINSKFPLVHRLAVFVWFWVGDAAGHILSKFEPRTQPQLMQISQWV